MPVIKIFKHLNKKEWTQILIGVALIVVQVYFDLSLPEYMSKITQLVQTEGSAMNEVWQTGGRMLINALGSLGASVLVGYIAAKVSASFGQTLRSRLFDKVGSFSEAEINRFSTSSLITRCTNDVSHVQGVITMGLQAAIKAPIMGIWAITKIAGKGTQWTTATIVAVLLLVALMGVLVTLVLPKTKRIQKMTDSLTSVTRQNLTGVRVVRAYNAEAYQEEGFSQANDTLTKTQLFTGRATSFLQPSMSLIMNVLSLSIYLIGMNLVGGAVAADRLALFSNMIVFSSYAIQVLMSFMMLIIVFILLPRATVAANRINEVVDTELSIQDGAMHSGVNGMEGQIIFRNVSFRYPGAADYALRDINFSARPGETVAFIGATGSGKSTLVNLIPRFYDATEGEVIVGGVDVRDYAQEALRNKIGYVPQKAVLFKGDVTSNVAFGENGDIPSTETDVREAVAIAQGAEFVQRMEGGYEGKISQGAGNLSGGQKQRLSIARAICRKPDIFIFDDSFSALDYRTDRTLRSKLKKETKGVTSLIVAQRIGTIMDADQIIVLDEGRVVGRGTHAELLRSCEVYMEIASSQLSEEELSA